MTRARLLGLLLVGVVVTWNAVSVWATPLAPYLVWPSTRLLERFTGLTMVKPVPVRDMEPEEAKAYLSADLERDLKDVDLDAQSALLFQFGFLPEPVDLKAVTLHMISTQAAAFYDPRTGAFHNISRFGPTDLLGEPVVVAHELTHALQDQARGGMVPLLDHRKDDDDALRAVQWLLEGQATVVGNRAGYVLGPPFPGPPGYTFGEASTWVSWTPAYARLAMMGAELVSAGMTPPPFMQAMLLAPYLDGSQAFWTLEAHLGKQAHRQLLCHPPQSTEELMDPTRYLRGDDPPLKVELPASPNGVAVRTQMTHGAWALSWLLSQVTSPQVATQAALGWGGDRMALNKNGDAVWRVVMDTQADAQELEPLLRLALASSARNGAVPVVVKRHGLEVHAYTPGASAWAAGLTLAPVGAYPPDPPPPAHSQCR